MKIKTKQINLRKQVLIVDDHPLLREGLSRIINQQPDFVVCGEAGDAPRALAATGRLNPNLAIVDLSLKEGSGLELIKALKAQSPTLAILVLSMHDEALYAERALRAGAMGYIMKQAASAELLKAIRQVAEGEIYVSEVMAKKLLRGFTPGGRPGNVSPIERLSDRELEIFHLFGTGHSRSQIADHLHLSVKTVETHRANIRRKLNLKTAAELLRHAIQWIERPLAS